MKRATINALGIAFFFAVLAGAQGAGTYPSRPIRLIVAFAPGGVADVMGRLVAQALQSRLNQSVVVENKPGGDGLIGMGDVGARRAGRLYASGRRLRRSGYSAADARRLSASTCAATWSRSR